jgi:hypothetical protein
MSRKIKQFLLTWVVATIAFSLFIGIVCLTVSGGLPGVILGTLLFTALFASLAVF